MFSVGGVMFCHVPAAGRALQLPTTCSTTVTATVAVAVGLATLEATI
jgi:hypothetical protein